MHKKLPEFYIATDVEADGPIPGPYSMLSLGMAVVGWPNLRLYTEIQPISNDFVPGALAVSGLDRDRLLREAPPPDVAMAHAARVTPPDPPAAPRLLPPRHPRGRFSPGSAMCVAESA